MRQGDQARTSVDRDLQGSVQKAVGFNRSIELSSFNFYSPMNIIKGAKRGQKLAKADAVHCLQESNLTGDQLINQAGGQWLQQLNCNLDTRSDPSLPEDKLHWLFELQ